MTYAVISDRQVAHRANTRGEVIVRVVRARLDDGRFVEILSIMDWESGVHIRDIEDSFVPTAAERKAASEAAAPSDLDAVPYGC
jgi:hypothetical protein